MQPDYVSPDGRVRLYNADALDVLVQLDFAEIDVAIVDPPYSSGGFTRSDKSLPTSQKYQQSGVVKAYQQFAGDNRDGRSFLMWCDLWMRMLRRATKTGGYLLTFTDWRQLPTITDAIQSAGYVWRGIVPWDKTLSSRAPHKGYFRHQCEYVVWGTVGVCPKATHDGPYPGCITQRVDHRKKYHMTGKPIEVMRELVRCAKPDALICDSFMGSGSTGVAAVETGRRFIGVESDPAIFAIARDRIAAAIAGETYNPKAA